MVPAPNLTDLRTRKTLAAGLEELTAGKLREWLHNPEDIKPGNNMAARAFIYRDGDINLTDEEVDALIAYLLNLP